jgi:hypothetical protein
VGRGTGGRETKDKEATDEELKDGRRRGRGALVAGARAHAVYELAPGLLLVFKPRGHREAAHAHAYVQRVRVLRGRLEVTTARGVVVLDEHSRPLRIAAGRAHATRALAGTWLVAERDPSGPRARRTRLRGNARPGGPRRPPRVTLVRHRVRASARSAALPRGSCRAPVTRPGAGRGGRAGSCCRPR